MTNQAWVTLATNDSYGLGALVLAHSLRRAGSAYPAVVLITPSVTEAMSERLRAVFAEVVVVDILDSRDAAHLALLQRPELGVTFTKIHCWNLTQYEKCVFLDADTLIVQNCDELFEREELSAAPDVGWPDCFNSGVFVFVPSAETFSNLIKFASERGSFDGGDQGLLNSFFSDWAHGDINKHLPFLYNVTSAAFYSYIPALKHYGQNLKIIHFIGAGKPWLQHYNWQSRSVDAPEHLREFLQLWWDLFVGQVHSQLDTTMDFTVHDRKYLAIPFIKSSKSIHSHNNVRSDQYNMCSKQSPMESRIEEDEVVEELPAIPQAETIDYIEPTVNYTYYEPVLDPDSEFSWHHPDNQITDIDIKVPELDINQFHDPWNIYRGNIPPHANSDVSRQIEQMMDDYQDLRKHAWKHKQSQPDQYPIENQNCERALYNEYLHAHRPIESHNSEHADNFSHYNRGSSHNHNEFNINSDKQHSYSNVDYNNWQTQQQLLNNNQKTSDYNNHDIHSPIHSSNNQFSHLQHHDEPQQSHDYQHNQSHYMHNTNETQHNESQIHYNLIYTPKNDYHIPDTNDIKDHKLYDKQNIEEKNSSFLQFKKQNRVAPVYTVMMDHVKLCNNTADINVNGYDSDGDSDFNDEITPRHPYDGFYLRHRMTIDSRGRKICSHEIPLAPPSLPSESSIDEFEDALESMEDIIDTEINGEESHTGVAGNLARVVPGAPLQQEAVDELARRQGWEAGNIDYMGADSFDNIWAKISQTLSQPQNSSSEQVDNVVAVEVAKEAVEATSEKKAAKADSVKVPTPIESAVSPATEISASVPVPVEESALADVPVPAIQATQAQGKPEEIISVPVEAVTVESPTSITHAVATDTPAAPVESSVPLETAISEAPTAVETSTSVETQIPKESAVPTEPVATVDSVAPVESVTQEQSTMPIESLVSKDSSIPVESVPKVESDVVIESTIPVEKALEESSAPVESVPQTEPITSADSTSLIESATSVEPTNSADSGSPLETIPPAESPISAVSADIATAAAPVEASGTVESVPPVEPTVPTGTTIPVVPAATVDPTAPAESVVATEPPPTDVKEKTEQAASTPDVETLKLDETPTTVLKSDIVTEELPAPLLSSKTASVPEPTPIPTLPEQTKPAELADKPAPDSDSPPLANTPSKEEIPGAPAAKSEERRKPAGKLQLRPPRGADALPTPDSELEDAATLATAIIASELRTPTVTAASPPTTTPPAHRPTPSPAADSRLSVQEPEVPTPPVGAVSLAQIGVKPKPSTAAQIESSVSAKTEPSAIPESPKTTDAPKKKIVKKVVKKDKEGASSVEAPVPPPRKKEKKPKEK